jgi:hypothetical protein
MSKVLFIAVVVAISSLPVAWSAPECSAGGGVGECSLGSGHHSETMVVPPELAAMGVTEIIDMDTAHRAKYAVMSQLVFSTLKEAKTALADIRYKYKTFKDIADELNRRAAVYKEPGKSGEMGLVSYEQVVPEVAKVAFDVRVPLTKSEKDIHGPVCAAEGHCYLFTVFFRYRKDFFSDAWYEAEAYSKKRGTNFMELLEGATSDAAKHLAFMIWPDEGVTMKKVKLAMLQADMKKVGKRDYSAEPEVETKEDRVRKHEKPDMTRHNDLMERKKALYKKIPAETFAAHPEIYGMDIEDIIAAGYVPGERPVPETELKPDAVPTASDDHADDF